MSTKNLYSTSKLSSVVKELCASNLLRTVSKRNLQESKGSRIGQEKKASKGAVEGQVPASA